ncbi:MAG: ImmA/IrrE family metallo-endopeptidase [Clostridia bacterium]|nr:ImmA/IrrE family metallo-endopeptidase [Clostridia bacterium]
MTTSTDCAVFCDENEIVLEYCRLPLNKSVSFEDGSEKYIIMDEGDMTEAQRKVHLAHEIGHCMTGAFYRPYSPLETRSRCEYRANMWMIEHILPKQSLEAAFVQGITEVWELAEYFGVTEDIIRFACYEYFDKT